MLYEPNYHLPWEGELTQCYVCGAWLRITDSAIPPTCPNSRCRDRHYWITRITINGTRFKKCKQCGKVFDKALIKRNVFCSADCYIADQKARKRDAGLEIKKIHPPRDPGRVKCLGPLEPEHWFDSPDKIHIRICPQCKDHNRSIQRTYLPQSVYGAYVRGDYR